MALSKQQKDKIDRYSYEELFIYQDEFEITKTLRGSKHNDSYNKGLNFLKALKGLPYKNDFGDSIAHDLLKIQQNIKSIDPKLIVKTFSIFIKNKNTQLTKEEIEDKIFSHLTQEEIQALASLSSIYCNSLHSFLKNRQQPKQPKQSEEEQQQQLLSEEQLKLIHEYSYKDFVLFYLYVDLEKFDFITENTKSKQIEENSAYIHCIRTIKALRTNNITDIKYLENNISSLSLVKDIIKSFLDHNEHQVVQKLSEKDLNILANYSFDHLSSIQTAAKNQLIANNNNKLTKNQVLRIQSLHYEELFCNQDEFNITEHTTYDNDDYRLSLQSFILGFEFLKALKNIPLNTAKIDSKIEFNKIEFNKIVGFYKSLENIKSIDPKLLFDKKNTVISLMKNLDDNELKILTNQKYIHHALSEGCLRKRHQERLTQLSNYHSILSIYSDLHLFDWIITTEEDTLQKSHHHSYQINAIKALKKLPYDDKFKKDIAFQESLQYIQYLEENAEQPKTIAKNLCLENSDFLNSLSEKDIQAIANNPYFTFLKIKIDAQNHINIKNSTLKQKQLEQKQLEQIKSIAKSGKFEVYNFYLRLDELDFITENTNVNNFDADGLKGFIQKSQVENIKSLKGFIQKSQVSEIEKFVKYLDQNANQPKQIINFLNQNYDANGCPDANLANQFLQTLSLKDVELLANNTIFDHTLTNHAKKFLKTQIITHEQKDALNRYTDIFDYYFNLHEFYFVTADFNCDKYDNKINIIKALKNLPYNNKNIAINLSCISFILQMHQNTENPRLIIEYLRKKNGKTIDQILQSLPFADIKYLIELSGELFMDNELAKAAKEFLFNVAKDSMLKNHLKDHLSEQQAQQIRNADYVDLFENHSNYNITEKTTYDQKYQTDKAFLHSFNFLKAIKNLPYKTFGRLEFVKVINFYTGFQKHITTIQSPFQLIENSSRREELEKLINTLNDNEIDFLANLNNYYPNIQKTAIKVKEERTKNAITEEQFNLLKKYNYCNSYILYAHLDEFDFITENTIPPTEFYKEITNRIKALKKLPHDKDCIPITNQKYTNFIFDIEKNTENPKQIIEVLATSSSNNIWGEKITNIKDIQFLKNQTIDKLLSQDAEKYLTEISALPIQKQPEEDLTPKETPTTAELDKPEPDIIINQKNSIQEPQQQEQTSSIPFFLCSIAAASILSSLFIKKPPQKQTKKRISKIEQNQEEEQNQQNQKGLKINK